MEGQQNDTKQEVIDQVIVKERAREMTAQALLSMLLGALLVPLTASRRHKYALRQRRRRLLDLWGVYSRSAMYPRF